MSKKYVYVNLIYQELFDLIVLLLVITTYKSVSINNITDDANTKTLIAKRSS